MSALDPISAGIRKRQTQQASSALPSQTASGSSLLPDLLRALEYIQTTSARQIASPPTQPGRASVAICIRIVPSSTSTSSSDADEVPAKSLDEFFARDWVRDEGVKVEILYIRRAKRSGDRWSSQLAFPGGRKNAEDENAQYTALRETWEEVGIDLAESAWLSIGQLDDREITTSLGKRLLMVLSPFVFLQTTKTSPEPELDPEEVSTLHWIPLDLLVPPITWATISISLSPRLSPRNMLIRRIIHLFVGSMQFNAISLPDTPAATAPGFVPDFTLSPEIAAGGDASWFPSLPWSTSQPQPGLRLWGLTLGMTLDLTSLFQPTGLEGSAKSSSIPSPADFATPPSSPDVIRPKAEPVQVVSSFVDPIGGLQKAGKDVFPGGYPSPKSTRIKPNQPARRAGRSLNASTTSVLPTFSFPDVDFFVWVFGRRYRRIIRSWDSSVDHPSSSYSRRINWSGAALSAFYSAVRKALICAIVLRAIWTVLALAAAGWWVWSRA